MAINVLDVLSMHPDVPWCSGDYYKLSNLNKLEVQYAAELFKFNKPKESPGSRGLAFFEFIQNEIQKESTHQTLQTG